MSAFDQLGSRLVEAVSGGLSFEEGCESLGIKPNTARAWLRKGRLSPEGRYGQFALRLDIVREGQAANTAQLAGPLTAEEFETLVAGLARRGSVGALRLWADRHPVDADQGAVDRFARFDELARKRVDRAA